MRYPGEIGIGSLVDGGEPGEWRRSKFAPDTVTRVDHDDLVVGDEILSGREPGDTGTDHRDSVSRRGIRCRQGSAQLENAFGEGSHHGGVIVDAGGAVEGQ